MILEAVPVGVVPRGVWLSLGSTCAMSNQRSFVIYLKSFNIAAYHCSDDFCNCFLTEFVSICEFVQSCQAAAIDIGILLHHHVHHSSNLSKESPILADLKSTGVLVDCLGGINSIVDI